MTATRCGQSPTQPSAAGGTSLTVNGVVRTYRLHVPATFQKNTGALVIVLHGSGGNGLGMEVGTGFSSLADQVGFAVVYPDGLFESQGGQTNWAYFSNDFTDDVMCGTPTTASQDDTFRYWAAALACSRIDPAEPLCDNAGHVTGVAVKVASSCSANPKSGSTSLSAALTHGTRCR
jgi:Esterase PHB depolymerase